MSAEVGDVDFVEVFAAEREVRWSTKLNAPAVMGHECLLPIGADPPDLVGSITADVKIAIDIESEAIRKWPRW